MILNDPITGLPVDQGKIETDPFFTARYFTADENKDRLTADTPEEAISDFFDEVLLPESMSFAQALDHYMSENPELVVVAYNHMTVNLADYARLLVEHLFERISEEDGFGSDDGHNPVEDVDEKALTAAIAAAVKPFSDSVKPWACEPVAKRAYTKAEVVSLLRKRHPNWFTK